MSNNKDRPASFDHNSVGYISYDKRFNNFKFSDLTPYNYNF